MIRFLCLCKIGALLFLENKLKSILIAISKYKEQYNIIYITTSYIHICLQYKVSVAISISCISSSVF